MGALTSNKLGLDILKTFEYLRKNSSSVWVEDDKLKVFVKEGFDLSKKFFTDNKEEIISLLKYNNIYSQSAFNNTIILKHSDFDGRNYPLSYAQERLWYIEQSNDADTAVYSMPFVLEISKSVDIEGIRYAIGKIISRHEILRTVIDLDNDGIAYQKICTDPLIIEENTLLSEDLTSEIKKEIDISFDLAAEYPIRVKMYNILSEADQNIRRILFINVHHIAADGWSLGIFESELDAYYDAYKRGDKEYDINPLSIQYKDFAFWQKEIFNEQVVKDQFNYWNKKLENYETLRLPVDYVSLDAVDYTGSIEQFTIPEELSTKIRQFVRSEKVSMHTVLLCGASVLLSKYSGMSDIVLGSPIANRHYTQLESLIGFFVNMQVNRIQLEKEQSFIELVQKVHKDQIEMQSHQDLPFDYLVKNMNITREISRHPIFQTSFVVQSFRGKSSSKYFAGVPLEGLNETTKFDLSIDIDDSEAELYGKFTYSTGVFKKETIKQLIDKYIYVLEVLINKPTLFYDQVSLLTEEEFKQIVYDFNATEMVYPEETIIEIFERQVKQTPDNIAVVFEDTKLTYHELNEQANQLGAYLRENYAIEPDDLIAVKLNRSEKVIVAILGVLKSGAAYVPIDPDYPQDRIDYIEKDTQCKVIIDLLFLESFDKNKKDYIGDNLPILGKADSLAYVIYTSGTTGLPKGVMIENKNVVSIYNCWKKEYKLEEIAINLLQLASISFDVFVGDLCRSILNGGKMVICPNSTKVDVHSLYELLIKNKISILEGTPALLLSLCNSIIDNNLDFSFLKILIFGSDSFNNQDYLYIKNKLGDSVKVLNSYGVTEATIDSTFFDGQLGEFTGTTPIGKPFANSQVYILGDNLQPVPIGVIGQMYISGMGVSRGYLNKEKLTREKFIDNPFVPGTKMYDTGDQCKWLPDGNVEFLGRRDFQVKIKGYRIELGEVETYVKKYDSDIVQVIAEGKETNGEKALIVYYITEDNKVIDKVALRDYLQSKLPQYMIPSFFVELESLPLTPNGKIDRKALPDVEGRDLIKKEYVAARNETEEQLTKIWQEVLKVERISIIDNFYHLGGDSIKSIQISAKLKKLGKTVQVSKILQYPTISKLSKYVTEIKQNIVNQDIVTGFVPLTPIQEDFFEDNNIRNKNSYNHSILLSSKNRLDTKVLEKSIEKIMYVHDSLRTIFTKENESWQQFITEDKHYSFESYDLRSFDNIQDQILFYGQNIQESIDITKGKLLTVSHFSAKNEDVLLFVIHHLVIDGVSWRIFLEDFIESYEGFINNKNIEFTKTTSYKEWSENLINYSQKKTFNNELKYWDAILSKINKDKLFPTDCEHPRPSLNASVSFTISPYYTELLKKDAHQKYNTEVNDILLATLGLAIKESFGIEKSIIRLESHGRQNISDEIDLSRTIGWFTSTYPFLLDIGLGNELNELAKIKEDVRKIPANGIGFGLFKRMKPQESEINYDIEFNYLGDFDNISGLDTSSNFNFSEYQRPVQIGEENRQMDVLLYVTGKIVNDKLEINVGYSKDLYKQETIEGLVSHYKNNLEKLLEDNIVGDIVKTPSDFSFKNLSFADLEQINHTQVEDIYPLSPLQEGLYFLWLRNKRDSAYFLQSSYNIKLNNIGLDDIRVAFNKLINRYDILRTSFTNNYGGMPLQIVRKNVKNDVIYHDFSTESNSNNDYIDEIKIKDIELGFDLEKASQIRLNVVALGDSEYLFIFSHHHIIMDGWCTNIVLNDFLEILKSQNSTMEANLSDPYQYSNYINWISEKDGEDSLTFWKNYLNDLEKPTEIPYFKKHNVDELKTNIEQESLIIKGTLYDEIINVCRYYNITLNSFICSCWGYLLARYNDTNNSVFGSVVSGRPHELDGVEDMVGLFINTIPTKIYYNNDETVSQLLTKTHSDFITSTDHQYLNLSEIQSETTLKSELINNIIAFENYVATEITETKDIFSNAEQLYNFEQTHYNFETIVVPGDGSLRILFNFNNNCYERQKVKLISQHFYNIIRAFVKYPDRALEDIHYMDESEILLLDSFNHVEPYFSLDKDIVTLFKENVKRYGNKTAIEDSTKKLSYLDLEDSSTSIANYLLANHIPKADDLFGVMMDRSVTMCEIILGIWKSGAGYVPIDKNYPKERILQIVDNSKIKGLFVDSSISEDLISVLSESVKIINVDNLSKENIITIDDCINIPLSSLAYVIYTSGSTGVPKGAMIEHLGMLNHMGAKIVELNMNDQSRIAQNAPHTFDISIWQMFSGLICGGTTVIYDYNTILDVPKFCEQIQNDRISVLELVPSYFSEMLYYLEKERSILNLKDLDILVLNAETLFPRVVNKWLQLYPNIPIVNTYGATESSDDISHYIMRDTIESETTPVAKMPIQHIKMHIVDSMLRRVPLGVTGEILITGLGVGRGYLNDKKRTDKAFLQGPIEGLTEDTRIYRTGDLGRYAADGTMEFLGRTDYQVKVGGHRIELPEIETKLNIIPEIKEAVVLDMENERKETYLVAFYTAKEEISQREIKEKLKENLPSYMIPGYFIELDKFPLSNNGKIDRKILRGWELQSVATENKAPQNYNELEIELLTEWKLILGLDDIKLDDNFFDLGGDSFKAIRLIARSKYNYSLNELYDNPTIKEIINIISINSDSVNLLEPMFVSNSSNETLILVPNSAGEPINFRDLTNSIEAISKEINIYCVKFPRTPLKENENHEKKRKLLLKDLVAEVKEKIRGSITIYGQCNGTALAIGLADELRNNDINIECLYLGALFPLEMKNLVENDKRTDDHILNMLGELGGVFPTESPYKEFFLENIRYDSMMAQTGFHYFYHQIKEKKFKKFDFPIHSVVGSEDTVTKYYSFRYRKLKKYSNKVSLHVIKGVGHYLHRDAYTQLANILIKMRKK
ncbi:amino acid adenylation domain-containing protein [Chryseobacterium sp. G0240]|uniref:non-ribosomal peptide synthetase n=1 Tax=Chryseobacterium sp. G0240 TaxID=2487066 RepID=UPI000F45783A|nr:non-ribosomal peptide synthetase [Chryseobacterium sp. G0240]ROI04070.1 amino acid adenylation domain-containing protein [Chryseobacterium sp. G0240]